MAATAEDRLAKRRINELEQKLKKLQRELREIKVERKQIGNLRKQALRSVQVEADCKDVLEDIEVDLKEIENNKIKKEDKKSMYRCRNVECIDAGGCYKNTGNCDMIDAGSRWIVICQDCGSRYSVIKGIEPLSP